MDKKYITKEQVKVIVDNAPKGADKKALIEGLVERGYTLQGFNDQPAEPAKPAGFIGRVTQDFKQRGDRISDAVAGEGEFAGQSALRRSTSAVGTAFSGIPKVVKEALPEPGRDALDYVGKKMGQGLSFLTDKISDNDALQKWVSENPDAARRLEEIAGTAANTGEIAGNILAVQGGANAITKSKNVIRTGVQKLDDSLASTGEKFGDTLRIGNTNISPSFAENFVKLDPKVVTVVKETPTAKVMEYIRQGEKALADPRVITPLESAGLKAKEVLPVLQGQMDDYGRIISETLKVKGDVKVGPIAQNAKTTLRQRLYDDLGGIIDEKGNVKSAPSRSLKFSDTADKTLIKITDSQLSRLGKDPTLRQVDDVISNIQDQLYKRKSLTAVPVNTQVEATLKQIIKELNDEAKKIGGEEFAVAKANYSRVKNTHGNLNKLLGEDGNKGGALLKRFFSPSDAGTKKLFAQIKKETGIDLSQDAVTAKSVMDILGDTRSRSLLEGGIPTSPLGAVGRVVDIAVDKVAGEAVKKAKLQKMVRNSKKD
jgi:hypothetical protein